MKKNRQSVIRDDTQKFNSKARDIAKNKISYINEDEEDMKEDMKDDSINNSSNNKSVNKKTRKQLMKEIPGYPNEFSSQRTDKNLLLKQNISKKSSEKESSNLDDLISDEINEKNIKKSKIKEKGNINILETSGVKIDDEKPKKNERIDTVSSWEEESGEDQGSDNDKKEINKKWYKAYYLTNLSMKLNHGDIAVRNCDEMITLCDEPLNLDQIKIILASKFFIYKSIKKITKKPCKIINGRKGGKKFDI